MASIPSLSTQAQTNASSAPLPQQVMMQNNPFQVNPNLGQIQLQQQLQQQQQQMGMMNPPQNQIGCNGNVTLPNRPQFMNLQNQFVPMQNAMMRPPGQFFGPQNTNPIAMNSSQPGGGGGHFFANNSMNPIVPYNTQNFMLPNGQFCNPMNHFNMLNGGQFCQLNPNQNMGQFVQMQMPNYSQVVPGNMQLFQNQVALGMPAQNPNFPGVQQFGVPHSSGIVQHGNQEQQKFISPTMDMTTANHSSSTGSQLQVNSSIQQTFVSPQQAQSFGPPGFTKLQGNLGNSNGVNNVNMNGNIFHNKNFARHQKNDGSQRGFKPQFHQKQNGQGKNSVNHQQGNKGFNNDGSAKPDDTHATRVERKPLPLNYTEKEIQQWREARKKNYPTKANDNKMAGEKQMLQEATEREAKLRRQQLKDILAKQAELGCEVAEIPPSYLSDSEQGHGRGGNKREWGKRGRFRNKFNKRERSYQAERFTKKQNSGHHDPSESNYDENKMKKQFINRDHTARPSMNEKEPTLLQKLLAADLSRDKSHLLQVFRFMVENSFFNDWPEKPLRFPLVIITENRADDEVIGPEAYPVETSINDDEGEPSAQAPEGETNSLAKETCEKKVLEPEEEEGEIID